MSKVRIIALILLIIGAGIGYFVVSSEQNPDSNFLFSYGLDLDGGTRLVYRADVSELESSAISGSMDTLRKTIEKRVNVFGVSEPIVTVEKGSIFGSKEDENRLSVELPGVTDIEQAIKSIGETPLLEFRLAKKDADLTLINNLSASSTEQEIKEAIYNQYESTGLTGGQLERATVIFGSQTGSAGSGVSLKFNKEGAELLGELTKGNVGNVMAIFLDGELISDPVIRQELFGGEAQITGDFSAEEARDLAQNLSFGALPVPIELIETNTIGPSLGHATLESGVKALAIAFVLILIFLVVWYRLPGLIATFSLAIYVSIMLALFKLIPVTLTASGLAGFILSLGMAVDANILIFERIKEELRNKKDLPDAIKEGFKRAWSAIRDGNITSIIASAILFWMSGTSLVKGFALVFALGVIVSMITAVSVSRTFLLALSRPGRGSPLAAKESAGKYSKLFETGFGNPKEK